MQTALAMGRGHYSKASKERAETRARMLQRADGDLITAMRLEVLTVIPEARTSPLIGGSGRQGCAAVIRAFDSNRTEAGRFCCGVRSRRAILDLRSLALAKPMKRRESITLLGNAR